ncbi:MAG TPA: RNA polymerase sigma factor [Polyangiaceae bacterium]|nr:RNA polymerase sigma factor [Polyangiaceae bacterium]
MGHVLIRAMVTQRTNLRLLEAGGVSSKASLSDEELIEAVQRGDQRVAAEFYDRLVEVVDHTLFRVFGRREPDHADLIQTTFEHIVRTLCRRSYARACNLRTWASTIASHVGFNALRARQRERRVIDRTLPGTIDLPVSSGDTERQSVARAELERLRQALSELKPDQAQTLFLHDVLGHELAEIALMLDVSVAAAQSRLVRGRRELYAKLEREGNLRGRRRP